MKITKNQLSQIIKEELKRVILEQPGGEEEEEETEEVTWDTADQDNQDAQHTPWASSKEEAIEWIEEHTEAAGVGTQDTIDLVTLLIGRIKSSGGDEDESWEEVSSFFEERDNDDAVILKTPSHQDISTLKKKLKLPAGEDWNTVGGKPRIWK